jgi:hypothetical protein
MFSTGSSVCCRLAGEVLVQPAAGRDCEMQAILGFNNIDVKYSNMLKNGDQETC